MPFTIGLTGGIGSGKSLVSQLFNQMQVPVIDTDLLSRELVKSGAPALAKITDYFGQNILLPSSKLNREKLRQSIFSDPEKKHWLEALLHPLIKEAALQALKSCTANYAILVVPLLLESEDYNFVNRILVVDCTESLQAQRVMNRDGCSRADAEKILSTQLPRQERLKRADDILDNNGSIDELKQQVMSLHEQYEQLSRR